MEIQMSRDERELISLESLKKERSEKEIHGRLDQLSRDKLDIPQTD